MFLSVWSTGNKCVGLLQSQQKPSGYHGNRVKRCKLYYYSPFTDRVLSSGRITMRLVPLSNYRGQVNCGVNLCSLPSSSQIPFCDLICKMGPLGRGPPDGLSTELGLARNRPNIWAREKRDLGFFSGFGVLELLGRGGHIWVTGMAAGSCPWGWTLGWRLDSNYTIWFNYTSS